MNSRPDAGGWLERLTRITAPAMGLLIVSATSAVKGRESMSFSSSQATQPNAALHVLGAQAAHRHLRPGQRLVEPITSRHAEVEQLPHQAGATIGQHLGAEDVDDAGVANGVHRARRVTLMATRLPMWGRNERRWGRLVAPAHLRFALGHRHVCLQAGAV